MVKLPAILRTEEIKSRDGRTHRRRHGYTQPYPHSREHMNMHALKNANTHTNGVQRNFPLMRPIRPFILCFSWHLSQLLPHNCPANWRRRRRIAIRVGAAELYGIATEESQILRHCIHERRVRWLVGSIHCRRWKPVWWLQKCEVEKGRNLRYLRDGCCYRGTHWVLCTQCIWITAASKCNTRLVSRHSARPISEVSIYNTSE